MAKGFNWPVGQMRDLNRSAEDQDKYVQMSAKHGGGFYVQIELFHQLHCLVSYSQISLRRSIPIWSAQDMLRQYTWRDYYERHQDILKVPINFRDSPVALRMHMDHCIEELRAALMCHGDVTPYLSIIDPEQTGGTRADFSPHRRCRKFDPLVAYMREHAIHG